MLDKRLQRTKTSKQYRFVVARLVAAKMAKDLSDSIRDSEGADERDAAKLDDLF